MYLVQKMEFLISKYHDERVTYFQILNFTRGVLIGGILTNMLAISTINQQEQITENEVKVSRSS